MDYDKIRVECYSGHKANGRPVAFEHQGRRREISEILDCWYEGGPDARQLRIDYFKVKTSEGQVFLLRYTPLFDA
jgi:hypothetical protein